MDAMLRGGGALRPGEDQQLYDTAETVHISSLALLKMLKHGTRVSMPPSASLGRGDDGCV